MQATREIPATTEGIQSVNYDSSSISQPFLKGDAYTLAHKRWSNYWWATSAAMFLIALPALKLVGLALLGTALTLSPFGWSLLVGGAALFLISSIAYACLGAGTRTDRAKEIGKGILLMLSPLILSTLVGPKLATLLVP